MAGGARADEGPKNALVDIGGATFEHDRRVAAGSRAWLEHSTLKPGLDRTALGHPDDDVVDASDATEIGDVVTPLAPRDGAPGF
jgi:hypothetical protein